MNKQQIKKTLGIMMGAFLAAVLIIVGAMIFVATSPKVKVKKHLQIANQYMDDRDYDEAIAEFSQALDIDEKCVDAYIGIADAYMEIIDSVDDDNDTKEYMLAFETLQKGYELTEDDKIADYAIDVGCGAVWLLDYHKLYDDETEIFEGLMAIDDSDKRVRESLVDFLNDYVNYLIDNQEYDKAQEIIRKFDLDEDEFNSDEYRDRIDELKNQYEQIVDFGSRVARACSEKNFDQVFELMHSDEYYTIINLVDSVGDIKAYDTSYGKIGVYNVSTQKFGSHMIYYGDYEGDVRQGEGIWLGYDNGNNYQAIGSWSGDAPNGYQEVKEWSSTLSSEVVFRHILGNVSSGLWDGSVSWEFERPDEWEKYPVNFVNGNWVTLDESGCVCETGYSTTGDTNRVMRTDYPDEVLGIAGYDDRN